MLIGIIGAPNKGKSTLFSAITSNNVDIADYPFTTIDPNRGIGYVTHKCPEIELGIKCKARNSLCSNGTRKIPINIIDVAGLVENAHAGKGMGNQFLNDLSSSDAYIIVVDVSGKTDMNGNAAINADPFNDYNMVMNELIEWLSGIIKKHMRVMSRSENAAVALSEVLTGFKINKKNIEDTINELSLTKSKINWNDDEIKNFSKLIIKISKPIVIAANKCDSEGADKRIESLRERLPNVPIFECSAAIELALIKADASKLIEYTPGNSNFNIIESVNFEKMNALAFMQKFISRNNGTGVHALLNGLVFNVLKEIVVYPVEDENKFTDNFGNVLPDAILVKNGSTAIDLARIIHTELANKMLYAIDARKKMRISKEQILQDNQIVKIVSAAK